MKRRRQKGVVLLLSLLVLMIIIILVAELSITVSAYKMSSDNSIKMQTCTSAIRSGYLWGKLYLITDGEEQPNVDADVETWASAIQKDFNKTNTTIELVDERGFINLSTLVGQSGGLDPDAANWVARLVDICGYEPDVAERIFDYVDRDKSGNYEIDARNADLMVEDELLMIPGITPEMVYGAKSTDEKAVAAKETKALIKFISVWPQKPAGGGTVPEKKININTAPAEVIAALSQYMTIEIANNIVNYRRRIEEGKYYYFTNAQQLLNVDGMNTQILASIQNFVRFTSDTFSMRITASDGNVTVKRKFAVTRNGKQVNLLKEYPIITQHFVSSK